MTILSMKNRKTLISEIINQHPDTTLIESIRKSGNTRLNAYLSNIRLDVIDLLSDFDEGGIVELNSLIDLFDEMNDSQLAEFHHQHTLSKLEKWCTASGDCALFDNLTIKQHLFTTGAAMTVAKQITASSTSAIKGFLSNPQTAITDVIKTEITSPSYGNWLAIGALTTLTALGFMFAYRNEIRRGFYSAKDNINQRLFAHTQKTDDIDDYQLSTALHRL